MLCLDAIYLPNFVLLKSILYIFVHVRCVTCSWVDRLTTSSTSDDQTPDVSVSKNLEGSGILPLQGTRRLALLRTRAWAELREADAKTVTVDFWYIRKRRLATPLAVRNADVRAESPPRPFASFQVNFKKASRQTNGIMFSHRLSCSGFALETRKQTNWA